MMEVLCFTELSDQKIRIIPSQVAHLLNFLSRHINRIIVSQPFRHIKTVHKYG